MGIGVLIEAADGVAGVPPRLLVGSLLASLVVHCVGVFFLFQLAQLHGSSQVEMTRLNATIRITGNSVKRAAPLSEPSHKFDAKSVETGVAVGVTPRPTKPVERVSGTITDEPKRTDSETRQPLVTSPPASTLPMLLPQAPSLILYGEYRSVGLDPPPRALDDISLEYPPIAGAREGSVVLQLLINEHGVLENVIVVGSNPPRLFDEAALTAFRSARFSPGRYMGVPVNSQLVVEVVFTPINRGASVSSDGY